MAPRALYTVYDFAVPVERAGLERRPRRVAVQALGRNWPAQVRGGVVFVARRKVPGAPVGVIPNGRLIEATVVLEGETSAHAARPDKERQVHLMAVPQQREG